MNRTPRFATVSTGSRKPSAPQRCHKGTGEWDKGGRVAHRLRTIEAYIVLLSAGSLILLGPLRSVFASVPLIPILATLLLFVVPGAALLRWFFGDRIFGAMALPISFALSMGIFAFLGVPFLLLHLSLASYLWVAGGILAASLAAVVVRIIRRGAAWRAPSTIRRVLPSIGSGYPSCPCARSWPSTHGQTRPRPTRTSGSIWRTYASSSAQTSSPGTNPILGTRSAPRGC